MTRSMDVEYLFVLDIEDLFVLDIEDLIDVDVEHLSVMHMILFELDNKYLIVVDVDDFLEVGLDMIFDLALNTRLHFRMSHCPAFHLTAYVHFDLNMWNEHDVVPCCYYYYC